MKKIFSWMGVLAAAAMILAGCAEEIDQPKFEEGVPFELVASVATKTVNDGLSTNWDNDDALNVFYAEAGSEVYGTNCPFTVADAEAGLFKGTLSAALDASKAYDWYVLYSDGKPEYIKSPASKDSNGGYTYIGDSRGQLQAEYGSKAHLVGSSCPLYGVVKNLDADEQLSVYMNQLAAVIELKVTNATDAPLTINSATIKAPGTALLGSFYFDLTTSPVTYTPVSGKTFDYAKVTVENPTELAKGESAALYFVVNPLTLAAGDKWSIQINNTEPVEKELTSALTFKAGEIFTVNYNATTLVEPEKPESSFKAGKYWIVAGGKYAMPLTSNYGYLQVSDGGYEENVFTFTEVSDGYTIQQADGKYLYMTGTYNSFNVSASLPSEGYVWAVAANDDQTYKVLNVLKNKYIQLDSQYGTYGSYDSSKGAMPELIPADNATVRPVLTITPTAKTVEYDVTEVSFEVTSNVAWTVAAGTGVTLDKTAGDGNGTVKMTFAANESEEDVEYTATVSAEGFEDIVVTVIQKAVPSGDEPVETVVLYESFDKCNSTGGNDGKWSDSIANGTFSADLQWKTENAYAGNKCAKFGASKKLGTAETPELGTAGDMTLTFKAGAWSGDNTTLKLSISGGGTLSVSSVTLKSGAWSDYTVTITGATSASKIKFSGGVTNKGRFFLDEVKIVK